MEVLIGLAIRPQVLGYLLLTCELLIVHLARKRDPRWFLLLPPLFCVWANCHGSFFAGLVVLAVILFCSWFDWRAGLLAAPPRFNPSLPGTKRCGQHSLKPTGSFGSESAEISPTARLPGPTGSINT
jgi:hypothetical protein